MTIKTISDDKRGKIWQFKFEDNEDYVISLTKKGMYRAGHYHTVDEHWFLLSGKIKVTIATEYQKKQFTEIFKAPVEIYMPSKVAHLVLALEDSILMEWKNKPFETIDYEPYRRIVRKKMQ